MVNLLEREDVYIVKGRRECIFRNLGEEYLLVLYKDESSSREVSPSCYTLNNTAALIWTFLKNTPTPKELFHKLINYYALDDYHGVYKEVEKFLEQLQGEFLVSFSPTKGASCYINEDEREGVEISQHSYQPPCIEPVLIDGQKAVFTSTPSEPCGTPSGGAYCILAECDPCSVI